MPSLWGKSFIQNTNTFRNTFLPPGLTTKAILILFLMESRLILVAFLCFRGSLLFDLESKEMKLKKAFFPDSHEHFSL